MRNAALRLDRVVQALLCTGFFWFLAALVHHGMGEEDLVSRKARIARFVLETMIVGTFGRTGGTILFVAVGLIAGGALLMRR